MSAPREILPPFISLAQLGRRRESWTLLDARLALDGTSTAARFEAAHLPGAVWLDVDAVLADPPGPEAARGRHPLPSPERFAAGLAAVGVSEGSTIVAYDDAGGVMAARLVWLARAVGLDAALLSPVPGDWVAGPVSTPSPGDLSARPWPTERLADIDAVAGRDPETVLLDARAPERFAGEGPDPLDPRPGHIPGAVNVPCRDHVDAAGGLDLTGAAEALDRAGVGPQSEVISSCGSGVTACHTLLVLEALGYPPGRLYPGSFSEWSRDPGRAVAVGG